MPPGAKQDHLACEEAIAKAESMEGGGRLDGHFKIARRFGGHAVAQVHLALEVPIHVKAFGIQFVVGPVEHESIPAIRLWCDRKRLIETGPIPCWPSISRNFLRALTATFVLTGRSVDSDTASTEESTQRTLTSKVSHEHGLPRSLGFVRSLDRLLPMGSAR